MSEFTVINHDLEKTFVEDSRADAAEKAEGAVSDFNFDEEDIEVVQGAIDDYSEYADELDTVGNQAMSEAKSDGGTEVVEAEDVSIPSSVDEDAPPVDTGDEDMPTPEEEGGVGNALAKIGQSLDEDPLDILPSYMITKVEGKPTLNKRGVSVLAFHFDVAVESYEVMAHPHETEYEYCSMRFTVSRDGMEYVGHGEAHASDVEKSKLLRMAETRAYKRAVIFATGTGIVGYQEIMNELDS